MQSKLKVITIFIACCVWLFFFYTPLYNLIKYKIRENNICKKPIKYYISNFDSRFGISRDGYKDSLIEAEKIWEQETGLDLFVYSEKSGDLPINLVYDQRQKTTKSLQAIEEVIVNSKSNIDFTSFELDNQKNIYLEKKDQYLTFVNQYKAREEEYRKRVTSFNSTNGSSVTMRNSLVLERKTLDNMLSEIKSIESELNNTNKMLITQAEKLNIEVRNVNKEVDKYNIKTDDFSEEFSEGEYVVTKEGQSITVYQFDSRVRLVRLLAHEFGHSLGIGHVTDRESIMYRLNSGEAMKLSKSDLSEIKSICSNGGSLYSKVFHSNI